MARHRQPGQSGNPVGRKRRRTFEDYVRENISQHRGARFKRITERLLGEAEKARPWAVKLVAEILGGKYREIALAVGKEDMSLAEVRVRLVEVFSKAETWQSLLANPEVRKGLERAMMTAEKAQGTVQ